MAEAETSWLTLAKVSDLAEGQVLGFDVQDHKIALYCVEQRFYATSNVCTHARAFLSDGFLDGYMVECPLHAGCFDVRTGEGQGAPIARDLRTYPVRVIGDEIQVGLGETP